MQHDKSLIFIITAHSSPHDSTNDDIFSRSNNLSLLIFILSFFNVAYIVTWYVSIELGQVYEVLIQHLNYTQEFPMNLVAK